MGRQAKGCGDEGDITTTTAIIQALTLWRQILNSNVSMRQIIQPSEHALSHLHFTGEETEVQRNQNNLPRFHRE